VLTVGNNKYKEDIIKVSIKQQNNHNGKTPNATVENLKHLPAKPAV
jgi:hypothetical protein